MKKILIAINSLSFGGIQKALINLLDEIKDNKELQITLLLIRNKGEYLDFVPSNVEVITANKWWQLLETSNSEIKKKNFFLWLVRGIMAVFIKKGHRRFVMKTLSKTQKKLKGYDIAVSYRQPDIATNVLGGSCEFVLNCVEAKEKIAFIHCDYSKYGGKCDYNDQLIKRFDKIATVSNGVKDIFINSVLGVEDKVSCVYNCQNYQEIINLSKIDTVEYDSDTINFVSVCRLGAEKGIDRVINALKMLKSEGYSFKWHVVGDGEERQKIVNLINDNNLQNEILLKGRTNNPYRHIVNADFFLLPSYHEAAPVVIGESMVLGVPVITTKTSSADELMKGIGGIICENSEEGIYSALKTVFSDKASFINEFKTKLQNSEFNNDLAIKQFYSLIYGN